VRISCDTETTGVPLTIAAASDPIAYLPIASSALAFAFGVVLYRHWRQDPRARHALWWMIGIFMFGLGAGTEALTTLIGWKEPIFRAWYISGAILGAAPLAQGTAYLLLQRKTADRLTRSLVYFSAIAATFVLLTPIDTAAVDSTRLESNVIEWRWVRLFSPLLNTYALGMLGGGASLSAWRYSKRRDSTRSRVWGNASIAFGALIVGIGGGFARAGVVEVLYVAEVIGLVLIWWGYRSIVADGSGSTRSAFIAAGVRVG
jgi:hypothetical protein